MLFPYHTERKKKKEEERRRQSWCKINNPTFIACKREIVVDYGWCYCSNLWGCIQVPICGSVGVSLMLLPLFFWVGSHLGSSCQVFYSRDIKSRTLDKLLGLQCKFLSFVYEGWKQFTASARISLAVMNLLCHNSPCLRLRILGIVTVEMIPRAVFVTGISQGQNYTPIYLKQSCWPPCV